MGAGYFLHQGLSAEDLGTNPNVHSDKFLVKCVVAFLLDFFKSHPIGKVGILVNDVANDIQQRLGPVYRVPPKKEV